MEVFFLDKDLKRLSLPVERVISLEWRLRFFECGTFSALFGMDRALYGGVRQAEYLCSSHEGTVRCGRIEGVTALGEGILSVRGRMAECLLDDRVILESFSRSGALSDVILQALSENSRGLPITVGEDSDVIPTEGVFTAQWENLAAWIYGVLRPFGASFTLTPDRGGNGFVFRIVHRSEAKKGVLSASFGNIRGTEAEYSSTGLRNKLYLQGSDGDWYTYDVSEGDSAREMYRRAPNLSREDYEDFAFYLMAIRTRANEILSARSSEEILTCTLAEDAVPRFGREWSLGDVCGIADHDLGIVAEGQISGADDLWKNSTHTVRVHVRV